MDLHVEIVTVTEWAQNCMLLAPPGGGPAVLIDPGGETDRVLEAAERIGADIQAILITHGHIDHIGGLNDAVQATSAPVFLHPDDIWLFEKGMFGSPAIGVPENPILLSDDQQIEIAGMRFTTLHTPGHSPGHVCFFIDNVATDQEPLLIGGDLIFMGSIGRTDLPRGDLRQLVTSVREKIWVLPDETTILPGHGPATTIGFEKKVNPFVSLDALQDILGEDLVP